MTPEVEGVLMAFGFVFVFEAVVAVLACILLFHLVGTGFMLVLNCPSQDGANKKLTEDHPSCRISWVSSDNIRR